MTGEAPGDLATLALASDRRAALGLFLRHLARGERMAQRLAGQQAAIAACPRDRRFLRAQARQEAVHAMLFDVAAGALGAPAVTLDRCPYAEFETRATLALRRADLVESVVATQVVLEALGEAMLERLDTGIARHGAGFARLRRTVMRQEAAHHAFGVRFVDRALDAAMLAPSSAAKLASPYLELVDAMVGSGAAVLAHFGIEPAAIGAEVRARLPRWATP